MLGPCSINSGKTCLQINTMLGKLGSRYQTYCAAYNPHAMATCHGGMGGPVDRDTDLHVIDTETTSTNIANESTNDSDTTLALGRPEVERHPDECVPNSQAKLTTLMSEINGLHHMSNGQKRPASEKFGPYRTGGTESLSHALATTSFNTNAY